MLQTHCILLLYRHVVKAQTLFRPIRFKFIHLSLMKYLIYLSILPCHRDMIQCTSGPTVVEWTAQAIRRGFHDSQAES